MGQPGLSNSEDSSEEERPYVASPQSTGVDQNGNEMQEFSNLQLTVDAKSLPASSSNLAVKGQPPASPFPSPPFVYIGTKKDAVN